MNMNTASTLPLGDIQFYWRVTKTPNHPKNVVPDFLPFEFIFDEKTQLVRQKTNKQVLDALHKIYLEEFNVGYLQEGHALAESYGNDVYSFIKESINKYNPQAKSLMEVGCGGGYMLNKFRQIGLSISGVDPSPVAVEKGKEFGYTVIKDFYPTKQSIDKVDIIFHYDVLEHIDEPVSFLEAHKKDLTEKGMILFAVPDDTECIKIGDASMVIHEHINYFDVESLGNLVERAGFKLLSVQKSNHGGVLYCAAQKQKESIIYSEKIGNEKFENFVNSFNQYKKNIQSYIDNVLSNPDNTLGVYIMLRISPYISKYKDDSNIRFFDDDPWLHGKYYDGFKIPVENINDLSEKPLTHLIIASHSFGNKIKTNVKEKISYPLEIKLLEDFTL